MSDAFSLIISVLSQIEVYRSIKVKIKDLTEFSSEAGHSSDLLEKQQYVS